MNVCNLLAFVSVVALAVANAFEYFTGDGTAYTLGKSSAGNCNMMSVLNLAVTDYAALNSEQWDGLQNCGRCAEVSCSDDRCPDKSKTILVQLLDHCPECKHGALDLSPSVFTALTGTTPSRYKVAWKFVDCPVSGNINYCLKGGSNTYWTAVQPTNVATGVKSLQINGHDTVMLDSAYYYVLDGVSETQTQLTDMTITLTDINGNTVTDIVTLTADSCTEGTHQFPPSPQMATGQTTVPIIDLKLPTIELPTTPYVQVPVISPIPPAATSTPINPMPPSVPPTTPDTTSPEQEEVYPAGPTFADETTGDNSPALPDTTYNATGELTDATPKIDLPHLPAPPSTATPPVITATDMPSPEQEEITPPGPTFVHETTSGNSPALPDTTYNATGDLPHPPAPPPTATPPVITATDMPSPEQEEITPPGPTFVHETTSDNSPALPDTTYNATGELTDATPKIDLPHLPAPPPTATPPVITATDMPSPEQEEITPPGPTFVHETTSDNSPALPDTTYNATGELTDATPKIDLPHLPAPPPTATPPVITATDMPSPEQEEITPPGPTFVHETTSDNSPALPDTTYNATGDLPHPPAPPPMATPPVITATDMPSPKQEVLNPPCPTFVHETTAPHPPVQPVTTDGFLATASSAVASTVAAPPITSPITTPVEASLPPNELKLRTGLELGFATSDRNAIKPTQPLTIVAGLGRAPAPEKRPVTKSMDGTRTIVADRRRGQQPRQQKSGLPLATPASTPTIAERTAEGQALGKSDATQEVNTKSWKASDGTDPLIIILSTLGAVAILTLIATVVVAKRKKVEEQKAHEVEVPSMISAQSFDVQNSPTHGGHAFVAH